MTQLGEGEVGTQGGRMAIVSIGIDRYAAWPRLGNAVRDARAVSEVFTRLGFHEVRALYDGEATGAALRKLVTDDLATLGVNDSLVVFFAGHGGTRAQILQDGTKLETGYLIPVDADNKRGEAATWLRLDAWLDDIARLPANHILVILDACHSGIALDAVIKWRDVGAAPGDPGEASHAREVLSHRRSRRVITSARADELALDGGPAAGHSLFTGCLLHALTSELPDQGRAVVTGSELGLLVQDRVRTYPHSRQTPDFGAFELDDRGELLIPLRRSARPPPATAPPRAHDPFGPPDARPHEIAPTWSHLGLRLHCAEPHADAALLVTRNDALLEAEVTLAWSGARPEDPSVAVTCERLLEAPIALLHTSTHVASREDSTAAWRVRIPVPRTQLRTRKVTVRCLGTNCVERCYVVSRAGAACAALVWCAFAVFAAAWLAPVSPVLFGSPLVMLAVASGLWSWRGRCLLTGTTSAGIVRRTFSIWERALVVAALAAAFIAIVPRYAVVLVAGHVTGP